MTKIYFRCDSSSDIGSGHVIRCLTLANFLKKKGLFTTFICKETEGNLFDVILKHNHNLVVLSNSNKKNIWEDDAQEIIDKIKDFNSSKDWMVVDHYFLNKDWETRISSKLYKLFIIDDLCDRPHYGNILLNQNYLPGIRSQYKKILSSKTKILLGPKYALLSPEYKATRKLIKINKKKKLQRVIIFFGASDDKEQTIKCLSILSKLNLKLLKIDIVIGLANKKKKLIEEITDKIDNATLHVQIPSLCNLMKNADLYLGSGGTTTWERCCLGLPSIVISTSGNQVRQNEYLFKKGVIKYLGKAESVSEENIRTALLMFAEGYDSTKMSKKALKITNGNGAELVSKEFLN